MSLNGARHKFDIERCIETNLGRWGTFAHLASTFIFQHGFGGTGLGSRLKWSTHMAIARTVSTALGLSKSDERLLVEGSIDPDRNPDLLGKTRRSDRRMPHHSPTTTVILAYIWEARYNILSGQRSLAMLNLGRALHYVQDMSVGFSSWEDHDRREERLENEDLDLREIRRGTETARSSPRFVRKVIRGVKPERRITSAMSSACYSSAALAAAVVEIPSSSNDAGTRSRSSCRNRAIIAVILLLLFSLGAYGYLYLDRPYLILLCPVSIILVLLNLISFRRCKENNLWYNLACRPLNR